MKREVQFRDLGVLDYQTVWDLQHDLFQQTIDTKIHNRRNQTKSPTTNHFLLVEHNPVITLGKSGSADHLLTSKAELEAQGVSFFKIDRGGDITYHGPGQIVGYPILDLDHFFTDIHKYLRLLEQVIINTLADFEITATRSKGETGVWLDVNTPFARRKDLCHGDSGKPLGYHAWVFFECQHKPFSFRSHRSLRDSWEASDFHGARATK